MNKLLSLIFLLFTTQIFSQTILGDRIDYTKFDKKLFDSLMLNEVNIRRSELKYPPFIFDTICYKVANYQSRVMAKVNSSNQINSIEMDGVILITPPDRFEYFNMLCQVTNYEQKNFESEIVTGIRIGKESKTFTYLRLVKYVLDNFLSPDIESILYRNYDTFDIFSAFSVELEPDEHVYNIFITNVITSK